MLWGTLKLMARMPGQRRRLWEAYRLFRLARRRGVALLEVHSGFVYR